MRLSYKLFIKSRKNNEINIVFQFKNLEYKKKMCNEIRNYLKMFYILRIA